MIRLRANHFHATQHLLYGFITGTACDIDGKCEDEEIVSSLQDIDNERRRDLAHTEDRNVPEQHIQYS